MVEVAAEELQPLTAAPWHPVPPGAGAEGISGDSPNDLGLGGLEGWFWGWETPSTRTSRSIFGSSKLF